MELLVLAEVLSDRSILCSKMRKLFGSQMAVESPMHDEKPSPLQLHPRRDGTGD
jgi:hypothetical protein